MARLIYHTLVAISLAFGITVLIVTLAWLAIGGHS
jgi:hypothetical protein